MSNAADRIALAADLPLAQALELYPRLRAQVGWVKVGLSLFVEHGPRAVEPFVAMGARVFLDLKLHDIPNTVSLAAENASALGVGLLTIHASGGPEMVQAALEGAMKGSARSGKPAPKVLAVTVLTSLSDATVRTLGYGGSAAEGAAKLAELAVSAGADGLVCAPAEASALRKRFGAKVFLCTPGIRPAGTDAKDQARAETPAFAARAGSDLLVVGRPLYQAKDPVAAAAAIVSEITAG